jgi:hypothetical protein
MLSLQLPIIQHDYWWCLRLGQDVLTHWSVPTTETFGWSQAGAPIVYQQWLACVGFWLAYDMGGAGLTYLVRAVLIGLTYGVLWHMAQQEAGPRTATIVIIIMGLASSDNWVMRTQLFAYPLFALYLYCIFKWHKGDNKVIWVLPILMALWSNLHGSFPLGFVIAGTALVFGSGNRKLLLTVIILMLGCTLLNPYGMDGWRQAIFMFRSPTQRLFVTEWFPPQNEGWQLNIFFGWILAFPLLAAFSSRKLSALEWVLFLGFGWLALSGIRFVTWFLFIFAILTARLLAGMPNYKLDEIKTASKPAFNLILSILFLVLPLISLPGIRERWWPKPPPVYDPATPFQAVDWLKANPELPGPLWNYYAFGSYLTFALPSRPPWIDTRFFINPPEQIETYQKISSAAADWGNLLQQEGINLLMLSIDNQAGLIKAVEQSDAWCEQYRDKVAILFSRCTSTQ